MKPLVAVVGRPNVGKSTLFNRITGKKNAIVDDTPGVTRDRNYQDVEWDGVHFSLVDTGGFIEDDPDTFSGHIVAQILTALEEADLIMLVLDGKQGLTPFDSDLAARLRHVGKPVFFVVNKLDNMQEDALHDFYALAAQTLYPVSAIHGLGITELLDDIVQSFCVKEDSSGKEERQAIRITVAGRPNVGKSTLINRLLGEERMLVGDQPGTTRDAVDAMFTFRGKDYLLIDSAGIRRKGKVKQRIEKFSVIRGLKRMDEADIAMVLLDAQEGITDQDMTISGYALERGCAVIILLNKWDLVDKEETPEKWFRQELKYRARFMSFAPILTISAKTGKRINRIIPTVNRVYRQYTSRASTGTVNRVLMEAVRHNEPPLHRGRRIKLYYATQASTSPPTFVCFANYPEALHFSYRRYIANQFREALDLDICPVRVFFRKRGE